MNDIQDALESIQHYQPVSWESIPDFGLYMDQVITFVARAYQPLYGDDTPNYLSAPMINNYVKGKLIPRPSGKKYSREQIALLIMIVALKQISSMEDIRRMLTLKEEENVESLYNGFCKRFSYVIQTMHNTESSILSPLTSALDFAIHASVYRAGCAAILKFEMEKGK